MNKRINYWSYPALNVEQTLILNICKVFRITEEDLFGRSRERHLADARAIYFYIMHKVYKNTSLSIAKRFKRNHATILSACKKVEGLMQVDKNFFDTVNQFM